jgi:chitinase
VGVVVTRSGGNASGVTVAYTTADGTASAGSDYALASGTVSFAANETAKTITIAILDDTAGEAHEKFTLALSSPEGGATLGAQATTTVKILENERVVQFQNEAQAVVEGNRALTVRVMRSGNTAGSVSVSYTTSDGSATSPADYKAKTGTLSFAAGVTSRTFAVQIKGDTAVEGEETFTVGLSAPVGGAIGPRGSTTVTITDND